MNGDILPLAKGEKKNRELERTVLVTLSFLPWPT